MNFHLTQIPERTTQPRSYGLTMIYDKGLSVMEAKHLISGAGPHIDLVKLAFGTALFTGGLSEKIRLFRDAGIPVFFGGLLFEAYVIRGQFDDYVGLLKEYDISHIEVSDGSIDITHAEKCGYIEKLAKYGTVLSEIGSKDKDREHITPPYQWIKLMRTELDAGSGYIVAESRESGTVGIYRNSGEVREGLVQEILTKIPAEKILWEAPQKDQQLYFLTLIGANANLGNITPSEVVALEAMRLGLRGDSFHLYLEKQG
ncbi:MAG TPA: phosphosulfolactate synthase [Puia sp.]|jgi:phosphosulfolactate synthase|nr:phosphosulfolactate synthase [Puia sp.]